MRALARRMVISALAPLASLLILHSPAAAGDLKDFVSDLYGGDGITLEKEERNKPAGINSGFVDSSIEGLESLSSQLTSTLSLFSLSSAPTSFTFDFELGVPVRTSESLGPLIAERAETLGAGKLNFAFSYSRLDFKRLEGERLSDLTVFLNSGDIIPPDGDGLIGPAGGCNSPEAEISASAVECDQIRVDLDIELERQIWAMFAKYGVTDRWDVELVVPFVEVTARAEAKATILRNPFNPGLSEQLHQFGEPDSPVSSSGGSKFGLGDVILRSKYNFLLGREPWPDFSVLGQIELPTGDADNLLGTGETNFRLVLIGSRQFGRYTPHLNLGYELSTGGSERDNLRYTAGVDVRLHPKVTVALDAVGVYGPNLKQVGNHIVDLAAGLRWNVFGSLILNANFQVPMNRSQGLRPDFIWTVGFDYTFGGD